MKTITINIYNFKELSEKTQQKVLEKLSDINVDFDWWDSLYDDAKQAGLEIESFDIYNREISGKLDGFFIDSIEWILKNHGESCDTYKIAKEYLPKYEKSKKEDDTLDDLREEYAGKLCQCYLKMLTDEYNYFTSEEAILETIEANEYTFESDGTMRNE